MKSDNDIRELVSLYSHQKKSHDDFENDKFVKSLTDTLSHLLAVCMLGEEPLC